MSSEIKTKERRNALPGVTEKTVQRSQGESVLGGEEKGRRELLIKNGKNDKKHQVNINVCTVSCRCSQKFIRHSLSEKGNEGCTFPVSVDLADRLQTRHC